MNIKISWQISIIISLICIASSCTSISKSKNTHNSIHSRCDNEAVSCANCHIPVNPQKRYELSQEQIQQFATDAERGDKDAAVRLYQYYQNYKNDTDNGFYWLKKAAENGDVISQYNMGHKYLNDSKIRDKEKAFYWFKKAAEQGDFSAREELAKFLSVNEMQDLKRQANTGNADAPYILYEYYNFIELDRQQALFWLNVAAKNGHPGAKILIKK